MTWLVPAVAEAFRDSSNKVNTAEDDDVVAAAFGLLVADEMPDVANKLALNSGDDVDEDDGALVEGCRSLEGIPTRLNNLDAVSVGCTTADSALDGVTSLSAPDPAAVDRVVGTVADVNEPWPNALVVGRSVAGLLMDTTLNVNGVAVGAVEGAGPKEEVSGLAAIKGVIMDEEDIGTVVDISTSEGLEDISVLLRNRATL